MTEELTPRQIVAELDKYIVGQTEAKKSVAIALRNRWRRQQLRSSRKTRKSTSIYMVSMHVLPGRAGHRAVVDPAVKP